MANTRTKNVALIAGFSFFKQVLNLITQFISRSIFIYTLGAEYLGLNGLFSNILSLLALTELGIGSAISFYLYKPIADKNTERIKSLMSFYRICYRIIGLTMLGIGMVIMPLLPKIVKFDQDLPVNLYLVYFLYLLNTVATYLVLAYKQALPMANQEQYKIEKIGIFFVVVNCLIDILVLIFFRNYVLYLVFKLILVVIKNIITSIKIDKEYPYLTEPSYEKIRKDEVRKFLVSLKDVAMFRVGSTLYNCTDNIIISKILGTVVVGYYSNYFMIISAVETFIGIAVKSFTAGIGNLVVEERDDKKKQFDYFLQIDLLVYIFVSLSTVLLFQLLNSFIKIWVGGVDNSYILSQSVVLYLCISYFLNGSTQIMNTFREASGNFKIGMFFQNLGGVVNIVLSVVLGNIWGLEGIFVSTVICKGFVSLFPFMIKISKIVFEEKYFTIVFHYLRKLLATVTAMGLSWIVCKNLHMQGIKEMILELLIATVITALTIFIFFFTTREFKQNMFRLKKIRER